MGDFWSGETDWDVNQKARDKKEEADYQKMIAENTDKTMAGYMSNPSAGFTLTGSPEEKMRMSSNLSQVGAMTGKNMFDVGADANQYDQRLQNRINGGDATAKFMMGQRNRDTANISRSMAGKKVATGVGMAAMNQAQNEADKSIGSQMQNKAKTDDAALYNWVKRNQKLQGEALSMGSDQGLADSIDTSTGTGIFGSVICTELHRQGLLSREVYLLDSAYGWALSMRDPYTYIGYVSWARHVVPLMQKSKLATKLAAMIALPWAHHLAGRESVRGTLLMKFGVPACRMIGKLVVHNPFRKAVHA